MYGVVRKMVNNGDVADDIVQEIFVYYFEKLQDGVIVHHPQSSAIPLKKNQIDL